MVTDPIADMLTRIRNALAAGHDFTQLPASKMKMAIAHILKEEGFIQDYEVIRGGPQRVLKVLLRYDDKKRPFIAGLERVSKSGMRVYVQRGEIPRVYGGLGIAIVSTPKGVMTGHQAWRQHLGGELICFVW